MYKYIIKRLLLLIPVLIGVSLVVFVMLEITPGDPARQLAGSDASEEAVEQLREEMGLNDPAPTRFIRYIWNACHGDLGKSYTTKAPVVHEIMKSISNDIYVGVLKYADCGSDWDFTCGLFQRSISTVFWTVLPLYSRFLEFPCRCSGWE